MKIKKTVISVASEQKSWMSVPSALVAAMLISAPMPVLAAVYDDDEEDSYEEVALVTQRVNDFSNSVDFRLRYLTDDAFKFGEYNSQYRKGFQLDGNFDLEQRDFEDGTAKYLRAEGNSIGTKSRDITFEAGQQGDHKFVLSFDGIEKFTHGSFNTSRVADPSTPYNFTNISPATVNQPVKVYRERLGVLVKKRVQNDWNFTVDVNQENKKGTRDYANFRTMYSYPIDYTTTNLNLMAEYVQAAYQFQLGYELSQFENAGVSNIGTGSEQVQEPDNTLHTVFWNGVYRFSDSTRANAYLSYGVAEQNEDLIGGTVGDTRTTADAKVANTIARVGVTSRITNKLSVAAKYDYRDNDAKTDVFISAGSGARRTPIFDTTWESLQVTAAYRLPKASKLNLGAKYEEIDRPGQDRETTEETSVWVGYKLPMMERFSGTFKLSAADRTGSEYNVQTISAYRKQGSDSAQVGTQRPNFADRERVKGQFRGQYQLGSTGYIGVMLQAWNDDHSKAELGLREVDGQMYSADFGAAPTPMLNYSLYAGVQSIAYDQRGNDTTDAWSHKTNDDGLFGGFNINWEVVPDKVATSLDYRYTKTTNDMDQQHDNNTVNNLPELFHKVHRVELTGEYFFDKSTTLIARAVYEDYESFNWAYSTDYPAGTGWEDPNHSAGLIELGVRYQF